MEVGAEQKSPTFELGEPNVDFSHLLDADGVLLQSGVTQASEVDEEAEVIAITYEDHRIEVAGFLLDGQGDQLFAMQDATQIGGSDEREGPKTGIFLATYSGGASGAICSSGRTAWSSDSWILA